MDVGILFETLSRTGIIYLGVFCGFIWVKSPLRVYKSEFVKIATNVFLPFLILVSMLRIKADSNWIFPVFAAIIVVIIGIIIPPLLAKLHGSDKPGPAEICTASFTNALNFPFPVIYALAPDALGIAGIFLAVINIARNTVGLWISGTKISKESIREIFSFVPFWAIIIGLILRFSTEMHSNTVLESSAIDLFFQIGILVVLMTVGFGLQQPNFKFKVSVYRVGVTRFVVSSFMAVFLVAVFSLPELVAIPIIVQMIAPPAVYNGLYAERFGLNTELTSQVIIALTLVALVILPIELLLIQIMF